MEGRCEVSDADRIEQLEAQLRNTEHQLAAYRDRIDRDDLIRCLRASRDSYLFETYRLKDKLAELREDNDALLAFLTARFEGLPPAVRAHITDADFTELDRMLPLAATIDSPTALLP